MKKTPIKIIDAAEEIFCAQGYQGASLNDITRKANLSKGAFFHYYRDKNMIANDVLKKNVTAQLFEPLEAQSAAAQPIKVVLMGWIGEIYQAYAKEGFKKGCLLGNWALELSDTDEAMRTQIAQMFLDLENRLVGLLRPVGQDGKLLMEPRQFARLLVSTLQGVMLTVKVHKDKNRAAREFQALAEMIEWMVKD